MRLIDADALPIWSWSTAWEEGRGIERCCDAINAAPTIDAQPVIHAYWISRPFDHFYPSECSSCINKAESRTAFCPNCGADMRGDEDERVD